MRIIVLAAFCVSGAAALIYEVTWTRALALTMGSTTYAISTMLGTFMGGLAIGGILGGKLADRGRNLLFLFGLMELGIGAFGIITIPLINYIPFVYFKVYRAFQLSPGVFYLFQFLLCSGIMLVPTTLMGATFPIVSRKLTSNVDEMGKWVGEAYSANTFGAILGSLSAGFLLIPLLGVTASTFIAALLNVLVALLMIALSRARVRGGVVALLILGASALVAGALLSDEQKKPLSLYTAYKYKSLEQYRSDNSYGTLLFDIERREGRVKLWNKRGFLILLVGAKVEGTALADIPNTLLLAYLPLAAHRQPQSFLNIGLGTGVTLLASKSHVEDVSLVEINDGVVEAIGRFGQPGILDGVDIEINDARNYLLLSERKFDIISSEPSYPTEAATANLFTKEFYEIAAGSLNPGGVFAQWLPYYLLSNEDVTMMIKTFGSAFGHVYLWKSPASMDLIMLGSNKPFEYSAEEIAERARSLNTFDTPLNFVLSRGPGQIRDIIRDNPDIPMNTDDRPILEFHVADNFLIWVRH
jgi:spermidine synthase